MEAPGVGGVGGSGVPGEANLRSYDRERDSGCRGMVEEELGRCM